MLAVERVHPDAVTQERPARPPPRRVHRQDGDVHVVEVVQDAPHQFVGQSRLARATGAGDAEDGDRRAWGVGGGLDLRHRAVAGGLGRTLLHGGQRPRDAPHVRGTGRGRHDLGLVGVLPVLRPPLPSPRSPQRVEVARLHHRRDHALQAHPHAVLRGEDLGDAVGLQLLDLLGDDDAAATAEHLDVARAPLAEQVHHVSEVLDVAALVRRDGDALGVLLDGRSDDVVHAPVVPEVDHLDALRLQDPPHDVDGCVVAIEQARGGDEADGVRGRVHRGVGRASER